MSGHRDEAAQPSTPVEPTPLDLRRTSLARRLDEGYRRIDQAIASGADVTEWEVFWIVLLREYEAVCDELSAVA
jgi:hypothetical protein